MTRKDYVKLAAALKASKPGDTTDFDRSNQHGWRLAAHAIANALGDDNPRFDHARFLAAASVTND